MSARHVPHLSIRPPLSPTVYATPPARDLPFPLADGGTRLFARGRHALWQGVQALGLGPGDGVLAPARHRASMIEALVAAGLRPAFYGGGSWTPDADELETLLSPSVRALLLSHHLGFPQDASRWRAWCDERELLLLEDADDAWLAADGAAPVGTHGDLAVFGLYNTIAVPDGAALVVRAPVPGPESRRALGLAAVAHLHAEWLLQRAPALGRAAQSEPVERPVDVGLGDPGAAATAATAALVARTIRPDIAVRRRTHYALLLDELRDLVPPPFDELEPGASPFAFPVATNDPAGLRSRLRERGIEAVEPWGAPHPSAGAAAGSGDGPSIVALPVHQELRVDDLRHVADAVAPRRRRTPELRLQPLESFEEEADAWDELALRSNNVFATREWLTLWWQRFGRGNRLLLTACRGPDDRVVAILPLYVGRSRRLRVLRLLGHGTADQLGPICAPEDRLRAGRALRRLLDDPPVAWDFFLGELLPGDTAWTTLLGARPLARDGYPILRFVHSTWEEYAAARGRRFRKVLGNAERRLLAQHDVRYRLADDPRRLDADLDTVFALHRLKWSDDDSPFGANESFHRELARIALERGWLYMWFLEIDGEPVVVEYTFRFGGTQNHYQGGRRPGWDHASVGSLLFAYSVRQALDAGLAECRFLRGREEYKYRYANADPELVTVGTAKTVLGRAAVGATTAVRHRHELGVLRRWLEQ